MATGVNTATVALDECLQAGTMVVSTPMAHLVPKVAPAIPQFAPALVAAAVSVCTQHREGLLSVPLV